MTASPIIHVVTDRRQVAPDARTRGDEIAALEGWIDEAIGVVNVVQIRERDLDAGVLTALLARIADRARATKTRILVNDRADVAAAAGAQGVHLRSDGAPVDRVRAIGPAGWIVGRAAHGPVEVSDGASADYVLFGTVFASRSKSASETPRGIAALREAAATSRAPVVAIGGIGPSRAPLCREAGAAGVAGIGVFLPEGRRPEALGVRRAAEAFVAAWNERR